MAIVEALVSRRPNLVSVLTYHRVSSAGAFDDQMQYLAANTHVASMQDLVEACAGGPPLPPRTVVITFDDAYQNFAEAAWPALKRHGLPVTVFVPTAFPDRPEHVFWWDRLENALHNTPRRDNLSTPIGSLPLGTDEQRAQALRSLDAHLKAIPHSELLALVERLCDELGAPPASSTVLGWDDLRRLAQAGVTLGAHTRTHPLLTRISPNEARAEVAGSLDDLKREIGAVLPILAYPAGAFNDAVVAEMRQIGLALAFTTVKGSNDLRTADRLRLRRINVVPYATRSDLRARMLYSAAALNRLRPVDSALAGSSY
jgi:peptidoglycan/xylan/chitin deacetylase (PgdA/CDA1 family)